MGALTSDAWVARRSEARSSAPARISASSAYPGMTRGPVMAGRLTNEPCVVQAVAGDGGHRRGHLHRRGEQAATGGVDRLLGGRHARRRSGGGRRRGGGGRRGRRGGGCRRLGG